MHTQASGKRKMKRGKEQPLFLDELSGASRMGPIDILRNHLTLELAAETETAELTTASIYGPTCGSSRQLQITSPIDCWTQEC